MFAKPYFILRCAFCVAVLIVPLVGCDGGDKTPQGPEPGELEAYLDEHPELKETDDEDMDQIEGDEFEDAGAD